MADYSQENVTRKTARKQLSQATEMVQAIEREVSK